VTHAPCKTSEVPEMAVKAAAILPPVQLSAKEMVCPFFVSFWMIFSVSFIIFFIR
jgi:hypothetical protein